MTIKLIVAHNLAALRKKAALTQGELAEKFNYTDKSISKWEHGETMPDIEVLKQLCDFYGVTLDYLVTEDPNAQSAMVKDSKKYVNKWVIVGLSIMAAWLLAIGVYVTLDIVLGTEVWAPVGWICYVYAVPVSCIIALVFNGIWGKALWRTILVIILTWSAIASVYLSFGLFIPNFNGWLTWELFLIGIPLTIAAILWYLIVPRQKKPPEEDHQ